MNAKKHRELQYWRLYKPTDFDLWLVDFFDKEWVYYEVYYSGFNGLIGQKNEYWSPEKESMWSQYGYKGAYLKYAYTKHGVMSDNRYLALSIFDENRRNQLFDKTKRYLQNFDIKCGFIDLNDYFHNLYSLFKLIEEAEQYDILFINNMHPNFDAFLLEYGIKDKIDYLYSFHSNAGCQEDKEVFETLYGRHAIMYEIQQTNHQLLYQKEGKSGLDLLDNFLEWQKVHNAPTRDSLEYKKMKQRVRKRDNNTCQCCGYHNSKKTHHNLEVHHIYGYKDHLDYRTEEDNCITLCCDCHKQYHSLYGKKDVNPLTFSKFIRDYNQYCRNEQTTFDKYMEG